MLKTKVTTTYNNPSHCIRLNYPFLSHRGIYLISPNEFSPFSEYLVFFFFPENYIDITVFLI